MCVNRRSGAEEEGRGGREKEKRRGGRGEAGTTEKRGLGRGSLKRAGKKVRGRRKNGQELGQGEKTARKVVY